MDPSHKAALMERLKKGKAVKKAARDDAAAKGLPNPHPRKKRTMANTATPQINNTVRGIDQATAEGTATKPLAKMSTVSAPIDVPHLPENLKKIVKNSEALPEGRTLPAKIADQRDIVDNNTGTDVIEAMLPGQKESIAKLLKTNKKIRSIATPHPEAVNDIVASKTVHAANTGKHVPDVKAIEGRLPFSFSAMRKTLWQ